MKKIYYFVFYSIYSVTKRTPNKDIAEWVAVILMALLVVINVFCILYLSNFYNLLIFSWNIIESLLIFVFLLLVFVNIIIFLKGDRYKMIIQEFRLMDKKNELWGVIGVLLYIAFSVLFLLYVVN